MSNLLELPAELLQQIFSEVFYTNAQIPYLPYSAQDCLAWPDTASKDATNVMLLSRYLHQIAMPLKWRSLRFCRSSLTTLLPAVAALEKVGHIQQHGTIQDHRHIGAHVRSMKWDLPGPQDDTSLELFSDLLARVLLSCPHLTELRMNLRHLVITPLLQQALHREGHHIRKVGCSVNTTTLAGQKSCTALLQSLHRVISLSVYGRVVGSGVAPSATPLALKPSRLNTDDVSLHDDTFCGLLSPDLKYLSLLALHDDGQFSKPNIQVAIVQLCAGSLEELRLLEDFPFAFITISLRKFTHLRRFTFEPQHSDQLPVLKDCLCVHLWTSCVYYLARVSHDAKLTSRQA